MTKEDSINSSKIAEQRKNQRANKIKNRISKETHDKDIAESSSPVTKKLEEVNHFSQKLGEPITEPNSNNETPQLAIQNITGTQSLRDTLAFVEKNWNFFKLVEKPNGECFGIMYLRIQ